MNPKTNTLFARCLSEFAAQFDIAELNAARIVETGMGDDPREHGLRAEIDFAPKGQLSAIVRSATATVTMVQDEKTEQIFWVRLELSYQHHGGGSNGKSRDFVMVTETRFMDQTFLGLIDRSVYEATARCLSSAYGMAV